MLFKLHRKLLLMPPDSADTGSMITDGDVVSDHPCQWMSGSGSISVSPPPAHFYVPPDDYAQESPHSPLSSISPGS